MLGRFLAAALLVASIGTTSLRAQVVTRVLDVQGHVVVRTGGGKERPGQVYEPLEKGDRLVLQSATVVLCWPNSGRISRLSGTGEVVLSDQELQAGNGVTSETVPAADQMAVAEDVKSLASLPNGSAGVRRGSREDPPRPSIAPIHGSTVLSVEPAFTWPTAKDAVRYRLRLSSDDGQLWEKQPTDTQLLYPSPKPLERGLEYRWAVSAVLSNGPEQKLAEGSFTVANESEAQEANRLKTMAEKREEVFVLSLAALRLQQLDLISEAIAVYEKLIKRSERTAVYHAALASLYEQAGRAKDAEVARSQALRLGYKFN